MSVRSTSGPAPSRVRRSRLRVLLLCLAVPAVPFLWWLARPDPVGPMTDPVGAEVADSLATATATAPDAPKRTVPVSVAVPSAGISAPVVSVGVDDDGLLEVPDHVNTVGWYRFGPAPGASSGSSVLTGHVNDDEQGAGVFARLVEVRPGDRVEVRDRDGTVRAFRVVAREQWPKDEVPLARLFASDGAPRVVLLTCGGVFDREAGGYADNIAVTAVPVERSGTGR